MLYDKQDNVWWLRRQRLQASSRTYLSWKANDKLTASEEVQEAEACVQKMQAQETALSKTVAALRNKTNAADWMADAKQALQADIASKRQALGTLEQEARTEATKAADFREKNGVLKNQIRALQKQQTSEAALDQGVQTTARELQALQDKIANQRRALAGLQKAAQHAETDHQEALSNIQTALKEKKQLQQALQYKIQVLTKEMEAQSHIGAAAETVSQSRGPKNGLTTAAHGFRRCLQQHTFFGRTRGAQKRAGSCCSNRGH